MFKKPGITHNNFIYLVIFSLFFWLCLFLDRVFLIHDIDSLILLVAKLVYIPHFFTVLIALKIYKNSDQENQKILLWFAIANIGLLLNDISWYLITYLYFNITDISFLPFILNLIPFSIWVAAIIIFAYKILNKHILHVKSRIKMWSTLITINFTVILLFLSSINYASAFFSLTTISQIFTFIAQVIAYDFVILCLIYIESKGLARFLAGIIILISGNFFIIYSTISQTTNLYFYGELLWLLGLLFNLFGTLLIFRNKNYNINEWFRPDDTIKSKLVFWCFNISVISFLLFFIIAYIFSMIENTVFLGLPLFIMIYSIIIIVLSLYLGKHFEAPFKQIINNIKNLMLKNSIDKVTPEFFIKEFTFLQKVITDAFEYRDEQDKQRLIFERERINREIERVQEQNALKEEQLKLESQINETKLLQLKNEAFQAAIAEQQKFRGIVGQMVHDIGSPLATLQTIMQSATGLPENERIALREAAISITDITNNMLNRFNPTHSTSENDVPQHILIYAALSQAISQKRYQYKDLPIQFEFQIDEADGNVKLSHEAENSNFAFIKIEPNAFKRMLSNLINNAVDALDKKPGNITLKLNADKEWITIRLCDTGKGISPEIQQKIMNNMQVTEGKENGHGIGMMQIRETLSRNYAEFFIDSEVGKGTIITLKFPRITAPNWIATEIKVTPKDTLVILDDEASIHKAWDTRFKAMLEANPTLQIKHFSAGEEAVNFINSLTSDEKQNIYLLTDYELLGQKLNGLQVIEQVELGRCVLVTSHYADPKLHSAAGKIGIKILPKDLAHNIKIQVEQKFELQSKQVDLVVIEDVRIFIDSIVQTHYKDMKVDVYYDPISFLENVDQYPLNTRMIIDSTYNYDGNEYDINGFDVALKLHEKGYTKLYLFTSDNYREELLPPYLKYLNKLDREVVKNLHKL